MSCTGCGLDRLVAFSCKGRAVCPSCRGRRMADVAAHLVDRLLPAAPYRQWTLSVPWRWRLALAGDRRLLSRASTAVVRAVFRWQRQRARALGIVDAAPGAVTALQRFGSALNLNVHFHTLVPDGVFVPDGADAARFVPLPPPTDDDVAAICDRAARRIGKLFDGRDGDDDASDDHHGTAAMVADAARAPLGAMPAGWLPPPEAARRLTAVVDDFTLHAGTTVAAHDRAGLERLCRCGARPPFAHQRLRLTPAGRVGYRLRRPWFTGQTELVLDPVPFLRRLAALIPPPRQNQTRYAGVFAANARLRPAVTALVPGAPRPPAHGHGRSSAAAQPPSRLPWAELFRRVFREDLLACPRCPARMEVLAAITAPDAVDAILTHLGLASQPPPIAPARAPPQPSWWSSGPAGHPAADAFEPA